MKYPLIILLLALLVSVRAHAAESTGLEVAYTLNGRAQTAFLTAVADTCISKGKTEPRGDRLSLVLRDVRFYQALIRFDFSTLPKGAQITDASFVFTVRGVERKDLPGQLRFFRVLTPWTEEATWSSNGASPAVDWDGLRNDIDIDREPVTVAHEESFNDLQEGGQRLRIPGFGGVVRLWVAGGAPNHGLLISFYGRAVQLEIPSREAAAR